MNTLQHYRYDKSLWGGNLVVISACSSTDQWLILEPADEEKHHTL